MYRLACLACAALCLVSLPLTAQVILQSDLSSDTGFVVLDGPSTNFEFGYDYSEFDSIPEAPNSALLGGQPVEGLRLEANTSAGIVTAIAVATDGLELNGRYQVQVDAWLNYNFPAGTAGTTEFGGLSIGHGAAVEGLDGASFLYDTDGDTAADYRLYKNDVLLGLESGAYALESLNNVDEPFVSVFAPVDLETAVPDQFLTGETPAGTGGFRWTTIVAEVDSNAIGAGATSDPGVATFTITDAASGTSIEIGSVDNSDGGEVVSMTGDVALVFTDIFTSVSSDPLLSFGLFDNLIVSELASFDLGDLNMDGEVDLTDMELLCAGVAAGDNAGSLDLNNDGLLNDADVAVMLEAANRISGDADFNGTVDFPDFLSLSNNFGGPANWSGGDFDCSGDVAFPDFLILSGTFGQTAAAAVATAVPEPSGIGLACGALATLVWRRRR